jgi:hypothetical protein
MYEQFARQTRKEVSMGGELRVQLKICEGCGCLFYRNRSRDAEYCKECEFRLKVLAQGGNKA